MAYVSLYRKHRPQTFAEVIGQAHVTQTLAHAVDQGRLSHAYLFTGPRGTGKTSTARILAKSLNCERGPTSTPCNVCSACTSITRGSAVDVVEIDAASHGGVDDVRDLRERVAYAPATLRRKVYIVDECHMLSTAGWNAFLKTVEEPPDHVLFVFATTEPQKVLPTILSRTQRFDLRRVAADTLTAHCHAIGEAEGLTFEPGALDLVVRAGDGSVRDTLSVLDQVIAFAGDDVTLDGVAQVLGTVRDEVLGQVAELIAVGDVGGLVALVGRVADAGTDLRQLARDAVEHLRALLLLQVAPGAGLVEGTAERVGTLRAQAERLGRVELLRAVELLAEAQAQMRRGNTRLPLEVALLKAALPEASADPAALSARMDRLERRTGVDPVARPSPSPATDAQGPPPASGAGDPPAATGAQDPPAPAPPARPEASVPADPPPGPGPRPSPEPATAAPKGDSAALPVDLDLVRASWPAVLDAAKRRGRVLHATLAEGRLVDLADGRLTVGFRHAYHAERVSSAEWGGLLAEVFSELFGVRLAVKTVVEDGERAGPAAADPAARRAAEADAVAESEAALAAGDVVDPDVAHARAVETLTERLGATVVDDR